MLQIISETGEIVGYDNHDWEERLIEDCKAIVTEARFNAEWAVVEGYWHLGERIVNDTEYKRHEQNKAGAVLQRVGKVIGVSTSTLYYAIQFYNKFPSLDMLPQGKNVSWRSVIKLLGSGKIIGDSTGDEWYTPGKYIKSVRAVLGGIDLDPASCEQANRVIKAKKIYTASDSGLDHTWRGRVFINPPYSDNKKFAEKLRDEYSTGNVTEAIALLGAHAIETQWFAPYWDHVLCFTGHRINFNTPDGQAVAGNINGSVFVHLGNISQHESFADEFGKHGYVVKRWP